MVTGLALFLRELAGLGSFFRFGVWVRWYKLGLGLVHCGLGSGFRVLDLGGLGSVIPDNSMVLQEIVTVKLVRHPGDRSRGFAFCRAEPILLGRFRRLRIYRTEPISWTGRAFAGF